MAKEMEFDQIEVDERRTAAMPNIEELLQILIETNQQQAAQSVAFIMEFMDNMEGQLESVNQELQAVRSELNVLQDMPGVPTLKERLTGMIASLEKTVVSLQERIKEMRESLNERAGTVVANFKKQGVRALAGVTEVLGIKKMLTSIQVTFENQSARIENRIGQINEAERKYRESVMHIKNAGRTIIGKEIQKEAAYPEKGLFAGMRKPCQSMKRIYTAGMNGARRGAAQVERLEQAGKQSIKRRPSIADKLKQFKERQAKESDRDPGQAVKPKRKEQEYGR